MLPTRGSSFAQGWTSIRSKGLSRARKACDSANWFGGCHSRRLLRAVAPRSGLATKQGLNVLAGVIDADYRGEIGCLLHNTGTETVELPAQSKICQLIIEKIITPAAIWADDLSNTERGSGGFGSTG